MEIKTSRDTRCVHTPCTQTPLEVCSCTKRAKPGDSEFI